MPFERGRLKTGGRKKGSVNLQTKCDEVGIDVFKRMLELCQEAQEQGDSDKEFYRLEKIVQYLHAKPKDELDFSKLTPEQIRESLLGIVNDEERGA